MSEGLKLPRFSIGVGDRFAHQAKAQLAACVLASEAGVEVVPVWNKSNREHTIIGSAPAETRAAADAAVQALQWWQPYFCDADHINLTTVESFVQASDFFTVDVADFVDQNLDAPMVEGLVKAARTFPHELSIPGIDRSFIIDEAAVRTAGSKFLPAIREAGRIYRRIAELKGPDNFITEISVDETDRPQNPVELFLILLMIREESIPVQTIAPKFTAAPTATIPQPMMAPVNACVVEIGNPVRVARITVRPAPAATARTKYSEPTN